MSPRFEGTDHDAAAYKTEIDVDPATLAEEAAFDESLGLPTVGTRGDEGATEVQAYSGPNRDKL